MGSEKFQESARNIILLHGVLHDSVPSGELLKSSQRRSSKGNLCLMFKTRYLTPHAELDADAPHVSPADLVEVDPYSVLEQYKNLGMHVVDNQVKYYDRVPNSQGTYVNELQTSYKPIPALLITMRLFIVGGTIAGPNQPQSVWDTWSSVRSLSVRSNSEVCTKGEDAITKC